MHINYIILAHKNPRQLKRLIDCLDESWVNFFIHLDKQVDDKPFITAVGEKENIYFLNNQERELGTWGDIDIVKGAINAIEKVLTVGKEGYVLLLTGQDYPLRSNNYIYKFLQRSYPQNFINIFQTPGSWGNEFKPRIEKYKINKSLNRGHFLFLPSIFEKDFYQYRTLGKLNFLRKTGRISEWKNIFIKRKFPKALHPFGGEVYWALPFETLTYMMEYIKNNPWYMKYHKYTLCADEIFFHSIIMHLHKTSEIPIKDTLTYVNWNRESGPLPVTFEKNDFEELKKASQNYLFARKFDIKLDHEILDKCDKDLLK